MAAPIYFLPGRKPRELLQAGRLVRPFLVEVGLAEVFAEGDCEGEREVAIWDLAGRGPGDKTGVMLTAIPVDGEPPKRMAYFPNEQDWSEIEPGLWMGLERGTLPTPDELRRRTVFDGFEVQLGQHRWTIPTVRAGSESSLPQVFSREKGAWLQSIDSRYRGIWDWSGRIATQAYDDELDLDDTLSYCLAVLGLNYRLGFAELNLLQLLTSTNFDLVVRASFGSDPQKKSDESEETPATPNSSAGSTDFTPPIDPAAPTSRPRRRRGAKA